MKRFTKVLMSTTMLVAASGLVSTSAFATDGYFAYGTGARQNALGGAGVADGKDATSIALNPAGLVNSQDQLNIAATLFSPSRQVNRFSDTWINSDNEAFLVPNFAYSTHLDATSVLGVSFYGNGGMNTDYPGAANQMQIGFSGGQAIPLKSNIEQMFLSVAYAKKLGNISLGVAPVLAAQNFAVSGLQGFSTWSVDSAHLTNQGKDWSYGGGVRAGAEWELTPGFRLGAAGSSPMYMTKFSKYKGLFAEGGDFDIPASVQVGLAADLQPNFTVMVDYKRIFYSGVASISNHGPTEADANAGAPSADRMLGANGGLGFGWQDLNIIKVGAEWDVNPGLTLRAGYSYNDQPLNSDDLVFNIIAPATVQHHITAGAKLAATDKMDIELAGAYVPRTTLNGADHGPGGDANDCGGGGACGPGGDDTVGLRMSQWQATVGVIYKLGE